MIDVSTSYQLALAVLTLRANQLDIARFLRDVILKWGRPLELRVDLAGEHTAFQLYTFLKGRLDIGLQYKDNRSPKLNASVEVLHRIHSVLTAEVSLAEKIPLFASVDNKVFASLEGFEKAAIRADEVYAERPIVRLRRSPSHMMQGHPNVAREVEPSLMEQSCFFEWTCRVKRAARSIFVCDLEIKHSLLRFYTKVRVRFYPSYDGDRLEVRAVNREGVLFRCTVNKS